MLSRMLHRLFRHQYWGIGIVPAPIHALLDPAFQPDVRWLPEASDRRCFRADPFPVHSDGRLFVLYEEYDYEADKGHIAVSEIDGGRWLSPGVPAIDAPFHMSYPYPIQYGGRTYCIPESAAAGEIALYEAVDFPASWAKRAVLLADVPGLDGTVFQHDGLWWLACCRLDAHDFGKLFLWYAEDLFGPWQPHRRNPVKCDIRSARPAGTPFRHEGRLYRPAQDCSRTYGGAIVLNHVRRLTPSDFAEQPVRRIEPFPDSPYPHGIHTISAAGDWTFVDGKRYVFDRHEFRRRGTRGLRRILVPRHGRRVNLQETQT